MVSRNQKRSVVQPESSQYTGMKQIPIQLPPSFRSSKDDPTSPARTHVSFFSDDDEEKKIEDDDQPLLPSNTSTKKVKRRTCTVKLRNFRRNKKAEPNRRQHEQQQQQQEQYRRPQGQPVHTEVQPTPSSSLRARAKKEEQKPKFTMSSLGQRLSFRLSDRRNNKPKEQVVAKVVDPEEDDEGPAAEEDPVIQIFESRNTQRVRFALEGNEETKPPSMSSLEMRQEEASPTDESKSSGANIKQFMSRALFGSSNSSLKLHEEMQAEVASLGGGSLVWESSTGTTTGPEVIHTSKSFGGEASELMLSFAEDPKVRAKVGKLLDKARTAEHMHFRYEYAVQCYLKVLNLMKEAKYPEDHPAVVRTVDMMNNAHHVLSSYNNSANIVKMGIKYEDAGELVRALKMYTIAYRIRRDNLSRNHPSLVVLLNMLGSIQIKRGELQEAMQIYQLALMDSPVIFGVNEEEEFQKPPSNLLAKSVTYREMGVIYERWGKVEEALNIYHKSLECVLEWKQAVLNDGQVHSNKEPEHSDQSAKGYSIDDVRLTKTISDRNGDGDGEMEVLIGSPKRFGVSKNNENMYESFFPAHLEAEFESSKGTASTSGNGLKRTRQDAHADMDLALTLHQIAQLHRCQGEYARALDAYTVALRGMKYALGKHHPNVAAVLGNIGNLQKEMGDMDAAYTTYQEVLGIESYRLGLSHPDVAITVSCWSSSWARCFSPFPCLLHRPFYSSLAA